MRQQRQEDIPFDPTRQPDWDARADADASEPADASLVLSQLEELLASVQASPEAHPEWEAACLMSVADLLDSLDKARSGWGTLSARLADARERADGSKSRESAIRQDLRETSRLLEETKEELAEARRSTARNRQIEEQVARLRTELDTAQNRIGEADRVDEERLAALERCESLRNELDEMRWQIAELTSERDELIRQRDDTTRERDQHRDARAALANEQETLAERGVALAAERDVLKARVAELEETIRSAAADQAQREKTSDQVEALRRELQRIKRDHEQDLVALCDLRVAVNRLEKERDDALKERRRKVKKILARVHLALDQAGAPRGDELSFGERIRLIATGQGPEPD